MNAGILLSSAILPALSFTKGGSSLFLSYHSISLKLFCNMAERFTIKNYFQLPSFVVVGASTDREKFGNKVLRAYKEKGYIVTPINPRVDKIEDLDTSPSLTTYSQKIGTKVSSMGVSIITPPAVTKLILEEGLSLGYKYYFLQPGTVDESVREMIDQIHREKKAHVIQDCVLVQLNFSH